MQNQKYRVVTNGEEFAIQKRSLRGWWRKKEVWEHVTLGFYPKGSCKVVYDKILFSVYDKIWKYGTLEEAKDFCNQLNQAWQDKLEAEALKQKGLILFGGPLNKFLRMWRNVKTQRDIA